MELATTTADFAAYTDDQLKAMEYARECGFCNLDYSFGLEYANRKGVFSSDFDGYITKLKEKCSELGTKFVQAHSPLGAPLANDSEQFIKDTETCIKACGELGIENVVVHSGYLRNISKKETFERNKIFYDRLLKVAEEYGVNILTENFNKMCIENLYWIDNAPDLLELIEYVDHPLFHAVWDAGHANMQEMTQEEAMTMLSTHIRALHIHDNDGTKDQHMCPFFGTLDIASFMKGLENINYKGYFTLEACCFYSAHNLAKAGCEIGIDLKLKSEKLLYEIANNIMKAYPEVTSK